MTTEGIPISRLPREYSSSGVDVPGVKSGRTVKVNLDLLATKTELQNVENNRKGYFLDQTDLKANFPNPKVGWYAYVGSTLTIWKASGNFWVDTGDPIPDDVDLSNVATKDDIDKLELEVNTRMKKPSGNPGKGSVVIGNGLDAEYKTLEEAGILSIEKGEEINEKVALKMNTPTEGNFSEAIKESMYNKSFFMWRLVDEIDSTPIDKIIYHIGNSVFKDTIGSTIELPINEDEIFNFIFTVILTEDNQRVYVPLNNNRTSDIRVNWGDGSAKTTYKGTTLKGCYHEYSGTVGTKFQITLAGSVAGLRFDWSAAGNPENLFSIDNNTLRDSMPIFTISGTSNLTKVCANTFSNAEITSLSFGNCVSLIEIEVGIGKYFEGKNITSVSFTNCNSLMQIPDDFFEYINLDSASNLFSGCKLTKVPSTLKKSLANCSNLFYMFQGENNECVIPSNLFDLIVVQLSDVRNAFAGISAAQTSKITGDAKALYDVLSSKMAGTSTANCFSNNNMSNRDLVPKSWGGTGS